MDAPTSDERTWGALAHVLGIFTGFIGPLVVFLVQREKSRFVAFHALQALLWHVLYLLVAMPLVLLGLGALFGAAVHTIGRTQQGHHEAPVALLGGFAVFWLLLLGLAGANMVVHVVFAVKAAGGKPARMPLVGAWAARLAA